MTMLTRSQRSGLLFSAAAKWGSFAVQMAAAFVMSPLLIRSLGDARYGVWSLIESVLAYLLLFDFGVAASLVRYVARFEAGEDQEQVNRVFSTCMVMGLVAGSAVLLLTGGLTLAAGAILPAATDPAANAYLQYEGRWMLALLGINLALGLPLRSFTCVIEGLGHYPTQALIRIGCLLVRTGLLFAVIWNDGGLVPLALAITAFNVLEHALSAVAAWQYMPGLRFSFALADWETFLLIRGYSLYAFLAMVAARITFQSNAVVIGLCLTAQHITFFTIASRLIEYAKDSLHVATTVLTPAASALEAQGNQSALQHMLLTSTRYVLWVILPIQLGLWLLGGSFIALWVGPQYVATSYPTLAILAAPLAFAMAQSVSARFLYGLGQLKWYARFMLVEAGVNLLLGLVLVQFFDIAGVALGMAIPNVLANATVMVMICRILDIPLRSYVRQVFVAPLAGVSILAVGWWFAVDWSAPPTWTAFLLTGGVGVIGYGITAVLIEFGPRSVFHWLFRIPSSEVRARRSALTLRPHEPAPRQPACAPSEHSPANAAEHAPIGATVESA